MAACSRCGEESPGGFRFCGACGAPLAPEGGADERKTVTVLFADLVGFTSLADSRDSEDVQLLLAPVHRELRRVVTSFGGAVEKFIGDGMMAVFGIPAAREDDPERAVRAALELREAVAELGDGGRGARLGVRVGVNTGEALVRHDVVPGHGERIAADFVNVAARLEQAAPENGILVGRTTYVATARVLEYEAFEPILAKGKSEPILAWRAVGARSRIGADPRRTLATGLVGRERELETLVAAFARARAERMPRRVTLLGPPGIGKSRLLHELAAVAEADPELVRWRRGTCQRFGSGSAFSPLAEIVKAQAGILDTDTPDEARRKLALELERVAAREDERPWLETHLQRLVGAAGAGADRDPGEHDRAEAFAAWRRLFELLAAEGPLVLVLEDVHEADADMLDFVEHLAEWVAAVPLLVAVSARPDLVELRPGWGVAGPAADVIELGALADEAMTRFLTALLAAAELPDAHAEALLERCAGNPLYAEEYVRMLAEQPAVGELGMPSTVQGIIAARVDALDAAEKALLQDAAVIGSSFWPGAVATVSGVARRAVLERLERLAARRLVERERDTGVEGEPEFSFRHVLVRDVAYGQIPRARRIEKHRLAAQWLESLPRAGDYAEQLAHHYAHALELAESVSGVDEELVERARRALADAGERASGLHAYAGAARYFALALATWPRHDAAWPLLRFKHGRALVWAEESGRDILLEARDALLAAGETGLAAEAEILLGRLAFRIGDGDATLEHYRAAAELLTTAPESASKARVLQALARGLLISGESAAALMVGREALTIAERIGLDEVVASALLVTGLARTDRGDERGLAEAERGLELAEQVSSPEVVVGLVNVADTVIELGRLDEAAALHERAERAARRFGDTRSLRWILVERAGLAYLRGDWGRVVDDLDAFVVAAEHEGGHYQETYARVTRARIRLARGDGDGALADSERALALGRGALDPQALYPALACRARVLSELGERRRSGRVAGELLALLRDAGTAPSSCLWAHDLAVALDAAGRRTALVEATADVRRATPWLEAARSLAAGDAAGAAEAYAALGALPHEHDARARVC